MDTNLEGLNKVNAGGFAFFMESAAAEYEIAKNCELELVGDLLNSVYYSFGVRKSKIRCWG